MRNFLKSLFLVNFFIIIIFIIPSYGADVAKIAIVDTYKVLNISLLGKKMHDELKKIGANYSDDLKAKGTEIEKIQKKLNKLSSLKKTSSVANKEEFDKKTRSLNIKIYDFNKMKNKYQNDLREEKTKRMNDITEIIKEIIDEIGKKGGYLLIKTTRGASYFSKDIDLTDEVIKLLDSRYKKDEVKKNKKKP
jgi:outer membrane protein